jgi:hypothetical protein
LAGGRIDGVGAPVRRETRLKYEKGLSVVLNNRLCQ